MIAKAATISHGANATRYSVDKDKADVIKVNLMPDDISPTAMWSRMTALQKLYEPRLTRHHPLKNNAIRIEISPTREETADWTLYDWKNLVDDFIREFDAIDLSRRAKRESAKATNLMGSQFVATLHRDSKSGILHLHINANRIDMNGNVNDAHFIYERAMAAAAKINQQRGWTDSMVVSRKNKDKIAADCRSVLLSMPDFDWGIYERKLLNLGYEVKLKRDNTGIVRGYTIKIGNSIYKSSEIGKGRVFMPSKIRDTWAKLHKENTVVMTNGDAQLQQPRTTTNHLPTMDKAIQINHFDFHTDEYHHYPVNISAKALDVIDRNVSLGDGNVFATIDDVRKTALLLFAEYLDAATTVAAQSGGGGGGQVSGWGKDKDEDELEWARRCALMANRLCRPSKKHGWRR